MEGGGLNHLTFSPVELLRLRRSKISCYISPLLQCSRTPEGWWLFPNVFHGQFPNVVRRHTNTNIRLYCPSPKRSIPRWSTHQTCFHMLNALSTERAYFTVYSIATTKLKWNLHLQHTQWMSKPQHVREDSAECRLLHMQASCMIGLPCLGSDLYWVRFSLRINAWKLSDLVDSLGNFDFILFF